MSPPGAAGSQPGLRIGLDHQPRARDWHRPLARVKWVKSGCLRGTGLDHAHRPCFDREPMQKQVLTRQRVLELIDQLEIGQAIPSERRLSSELGISRLTVRAALDDLVRDGYLERRHGAGTFVSEPKIAQQLTLTSFSEDMRRRGMVAGSRTIEL